MCGKCIVKIKVIDEVITDMEGELVDEVYFSY